MRTSNEHITRVMNEYDLHGNSVLRGVNALHEERTGEDACVDHATFVAPYESREAFIQHWERLGLQALAPIVTRKYPAEHIALIRGDKTYASCDSMIGLSVSADKTSPINELQRRFTRPNNTTMPGNLQHVAMNLDPSIDMDAFVEELSDQGIAFMTPVLTTVQNSRTRLRQMFTASKAPYGPFIELIQRSEGEPLPEYELQEQLFNYDQIDHLYRLYDDHSKRLANA
jgi:hypothetical protein